MTQVTLEKEERSHKKKI